MKDFVAVSNSDSSAVTLLSVIKLFLDQSDSTAHEQLLNLAGDDTDSDCVSTL